MAKCEKKENDNNNVEIRIHAMKLNGFNSRRRHQNKCGFSSTRLQLKDQRRVLLRCENHGNISAIHAHINKVVVDSTANDHALHAVCFTNTYTNRQYVCRFTQTDTR